MDSEDYRESGSTLMEPPCHAAYPNQPPVSLFQGTCQERDSREFLELQSKSATIYREPGILCLMFICLLVCFPLCVGVRGEGRGQNSLSSSITGHLTLETVSLTEPRAH